MWPNQRKTLCSYRLSDGTRADLDFCVAQLNLVTDTDAVTLAINTLARILDGKRGYSGRAKAQALHDGRLLRKFSLREKARLCRESFPD